MKPVRSSSACLAAVSMSKTGELHFDLRKTDQIGAKVDRRSRYVTFQMAEVAVPQQMFKKILLLIDWLRPPPAQA
jgi:hypothetical protein